MVLVLHALSIYIFTAIGVISPDNTKSTNTLSSIAGELVVVCIPLSMRCVSECVQTLCVGMGQTCISCNMNTFKSLLCLKRSGGKTWVFSFANVIYTYKVIIYSTSRIVLAPY